MDTTELKIIICSYAYRDKRIIETIESAIKLADNPKNIGLSIVIQDSYQHELSINKDIYKKQITYIGWQNRMGFASHRYNVIRNINSEHFILFIM